MDYEINWRHALVSSDEGLSLEVSTEAVRRAAKRRTQQRRATAVGVAGAVAVIVGGVTAGLNLHHGEGKPLPIALVKAHPATREPVPGQSGTELGFAPISCIPPSLSGVPLASLGASGTTVAVASLGTNQLKTGETLTVEVVKPGVNPNSDITDATDPDVVGSITFQPGESYPAVVDISFTSAGAGVYGIYAVGTAVSQPCSGVVTSLQQIGSVALVK